MGLKFDKLDAVTFGDIKAEPELTTELKLRIQHTKFTDEAEITNAEKLMAEAFPGNEKKVLEFMGTEMSILDLQKLQAYLVGGETMLKLVEAEINKSFKVKNVDGNDGKS